LRSEVYASPPASIRRTLDVTIDKGLLTPVRERSHAGRDGGKANVYAASARKQLRRVVTCPMTPIPTCCRPASERRVEGAHRESARPRCRAASKSDTL
jgi:hypothetical protein